MERLQGRAKRKEEAEIMASVDDLSAEANQGGKIMTKETDYFGFVVSNKGKIFFSVEKMPDRKRYHLYEWIDPNRMDSLAVFKDEESAKRFEELIAKMSNTKTKE